MPNLSNIFKNKAVIDTLKTIGGTSVGIGLGKLLADYENEHIYNQEATKNVSSLMGPSTGGLIGGILSNPYLQKNHLGKALLAAAALTGPKQIGLKALDSIDGYTSIQNELADKNTEISKNQLLTALANKDVADRSNALSKKWMDIAKVALPAAGGLAGVLAALYAYNSLKDKKQPISLKIDNKLPERDKGSMYLEIPSEKISDKFYNSFSRELLFKDDQEKYLAAKAKEKDGMNLSSKEKKIIEKFEKAASAISQMDDYIDEPKTNISSVNQQNPITSDYEKVRQNYLDKRRMDRDYNTELKGLNSKSPVSENYYNLADYMKQYKPKSYANPTAAFLNDDVYGLTRAIRENYGNLPQDEQALLFEHIKDKNTPFLKKLISMILPMVQAMGVVPTPKGQ